jgi:hypothetical protein
MNYRMADVGMVIVTPAASFHHTHHHHHHHEAWIGRIWRIDELRRGAAADRLNGRGRGKKPDEDCGKKTPPSLSFLCVGPMIELGRVLYIVS